jgi:hypothetical protein
MEGCSVVVGRCPSYRSQAAIQKEWRKLCLAGRIEVKGLGGSGLRRRADQRSRTTVGLVVLVSSRERS